MATLVVNLTRRDNRYGSHNLGKYKFGGKEAGINFSNQ